MNSCCAIMFSYKDMQPPPRDGGVQSPRWLRQGLSHG
jgi:hypothetical protein